MFKNLTHKMITFQYSLNKNLFVSEILQKK